MSGTVRIYNDDCMNAMTSMPDKSFDLAIVDPPYGIKDDPMTTNHRRDRLGTAKRYEQKTWNNATPDEKYFRELFRVSKNQIVFGANHFISKLPVDSHCWLVWDKMNSGDFADCELAWTSFKTAVRMFQFRWNGMLQGDMKNKEVRIHPTQKPVALYRWILDNYASAGNRILDTHLGSGSIAIACYEMGMDFSGYEIDPDYFKETQKRVDACTRQLCLI